MAAPVNALRTVPPVGRLTPAQEGLMCLIRSTAEQLWDVAETIFSTGTVRADDWEMARLTASHLLAALQYPPAETPISGKTALQSHQL
jgi:hypothetical protein